MLLRTPLYSAHRQLAAKLVDFGGWEMPLHYGSQISEHHSVRRHSGMFDVSHMTIVDVHGNDAKYYLQYLLANDVEKLAGDRQALYSLMLNPGGGVIDDLMLYVLGDGYRLVLNCSTRDKDLAWLREQSTGYEVTVTERRDLAMIAVQGPEAIAKVCASIGGDQAELVSRLAGFGAVVIANRQFARTGYTGEDGLEIILPAEEVADLWWQLYDSGVLPAGLGARDTLRIEAGLNLYGNEMDEQISPLEANLAWTIAWAPDNRRFIGREAVCRFQETGVARKLVGILMTERGILRARQAIRFVDVDAEGVITSGSFSPTLGYSIALARVPLNAGQLGEVKLRGTAKSVRLMPPGFVKNGRITIDPGYFERN